jgi:hypothetical protein
MKHGNSIRTDVVHVTSDNDIHHPEGQGSSAIRVKAAFRDVGWREARWEERRKGENID